METFAFYSYKGGLGRSLLLTNAAHFLALEGKKVVVLDLDLEAPGLHYKFRATAETWAEENAQVGVVPYLYAALEGSEPPQSLGTIPIKRAKSDLSQGEIRLIPAGPAPKAEYWQALAMLGRKLRLDDPAGEGIAAFLDLKARIEVELAPDAVLIDSRTGISEIGGFATTLLADTVVCLSADYAESMDGLEIVIDGLERAARFQGQLPLRVVRVVSRVDRAFEGYQALREKAFEKADHPYFGKYSQYWPLRYEDQLFYDQDRILTGGLIENSETLASDYEQLFRFLFASIVTASQAE